MKVTQNTKIVYICPSSDPSAHCSSHLLYDSFPYWKGIALLIFSCVLPIETPVVQIKQTINVRCDLNHETDDRSGCTIAKYLFNKS